MLLRYLLPAASLLLGLTSAQVETDCNPMEKTCDPDPALGTSHNFIFNSTPNGGLWETTAGQVIYSPDTGAKFTINEQGDSPTIRSKFYFFWGRTEVWLKVAPGKGIVSSMMWLSDDLDEVDWEFLGSNKTHAQTNYFGKGEQDWHNGAAFAMEGMQDDYHNYTCHWTKEKLEWYIDSNLVRTLTPEQANNTRNYPQTPMRMSIGIWAGGDPSLPEGTREWAGGDTDYDAGPYDMYVKSAFVEDYSSGKEYEWTDKTGSYESIKVVEGNSTAVDTIEQKAQEDGPSAWEKMSSGGKIGVYAGAGAGGALLLGALLFYYCRQRRRGAAEARLADEKLQAERMEMERFRKEGVNPDAFTEHGQEYSARDMKQEGMVGANAYNVPDSAWGGAAAGAVAAGAAGGAMRSPTMPLMRDGAQSPRINSPAPSSYHDAAMSPRSPPPGGLGAPPGAAGAYHDPRARGGFGTPPPGASPFGDHTAASSPASSRHGPPPRVSSPFDDPQDHYSPQTGTFGGASPFEAPGRSQSPMSRSNSPIIRSQSPGMPPSRGLPPSPHGMPVRTETPPSAYSRMNSNGSQQSFSTPRQSPGPGRSYSGQQQPQYRGQGQQQGGDYWNGY